MVFLGGKSRGKLKYFLTVHARIVSHFIDPPSATTPQPVESFDYTGKYAAKSIANNVVFLLNNVSIYITLKVMVF